ncbi:Archaeal putative transposase ISC1217 [Metallosphaera yellowstonensis MK1]|uniref:Archaeal putative transposase ISC1217 n=1 Tax=Metallosphaera yellowstonensis MK1 TaxID=671065 RepID=H2C1K1_9CREN|nr:transposase [Metallosphaera yellowstonensis]EHP70122.1 Archaeal putative transposase ISC1217 [Metallosphaera yellowstonensis MK1]
MPNGKGQIEFARGEAGQGGKPGSGRGQEEREEQEGRVGASPHGPGGWGASVRNAAETFGLDYANLLEALGELEDAWRDYLEVLSGLVKGQVAVIVDDTVDHKEYSRGKDVSP